MNDLVVATGDAANDLQVYSLMAFEIIKQLLLVETMRKRPRGVVNRGILVVWLATFP